MRTVFVLVYDHKHGCDLTVCANLTVAEEFALKVMREFYDCEDLGTPGLQEALRLGEVQLAMNLWQQHTLGSEVLRIQEQLVFYEGHS